MLGFVLEKKIVGLPGDKHIYTYMYIYIYIYIYIHIYIYIYVYMAKVQGRGKVCARLCVCIMCVCVTVAQHIYTNTYTDSCAESTPHSVILEKLHAYIRTHNTYIHMCINHVP